MAKILAYTDNHYCQASSIVRLRGKKFSYRLENQIESINWVERLAAEKGCKYIYNLGDFFDKPVLNAEELTALKDIKWNEDAYHYFLVGNHEMGSADLEFNSVNALSKIGKVIDKPTVDGGFGYRLILLPYMLESNRKPLDKIIHDLYVGMFETQELKHTIIFSHNDISGIRYGQYMSTTGFSVEEITNNCNLYINGHLHNQTQVSDKILNLGNLTGQNFSEDATKYSHCAAIIDTDTLQVELIVNPYALNFYKFEVENETDIDEIIRQCVKPSVLTVKTNEALIDTVRLRLSQCENVVTFKLIAITNTCTNTNTITDLHKLNHIDQFKQYCIETLGQSETLQEELSLI